MLKYPLAAECSFPPQHGVLPPPDASSYLSECTCEKVIAVTYCQGKEEVSLFSRGLWAAGKQTDASGAWSWREAVNARGWSVACGMDDEHCCDQVGLNKPFPSLFLS